MGNPVPDIGRQQIVIYIQYFLAISLFFLHGYYNFETITIIILGPFCLSNYDASRDNKRRIAERNVRQAAHVANITGVVFITIRLIWYCSVPTTQNNGISDIANAVDIMNSSFYIVALMTMGLLIRLWLIKPGTGELEFFKYILRYPWRFIWPAGQTEMFSGENKHGERIYENYTNAAKDNIK
ncbi:hypothetical protein GGI35DRAFT_470696 [Trichoderma velutinum]